MNTARPTAAQSYRIADDELELRRQHGWVRQLLPESLGIGESRMVQLDPGLCCIQTAYRPTKALNISSRMEHDQPRVVVTVGLKGLSRYVDRRGSELEFGEGFTTVTCFSSSAGERRYEAEQPIEQLRLSICRKGLERYLGEEDLERIFRRKSVLALSHRPTTAVGLVAARRLVAGTLSAGGSRLVMHSLALSILASELMPLMHREAPDRHVYSRKDMAIAHGARDILLQEFANPPTVAELARRVGVNQFKLKQLFRHFFKNTPYGVLTGIRMQEAHRLLEFTRCPVGVAASLVGYNHASNFSAAFTKYFGVAPKCVAKTAPAGVNG